jgi:serine protease inhibitor
MKTYNQDFSLNSQKGDNMHGTINNSKLFDRNFQNINNKKRSHNMNIDRLCMERDFEKCSFNDNSSFASDNSENMGEITGNTMKNDKINKGMPMRSQYNPKKTIYDANKYLDFNLYDKKPSQTKVGYNESNNYSSFADISSSMTQMTQQVNPMYILNSSMENFGSKMFEEIFKNLLSSQQNNSIIICTFGIYSLFSSLYLISDNATENETKKFFNLPNKNILEESLFKLTKNVNLLKSTNNMINIQNLFIYGNNIPHREDILQSISPFTTIACVDINDPQREAAKLTYIINKLMGTNMRNPVTPLNIENLQIMLMTTAVIHPIWSTPFDSIGKGMFFGLDGEKKQSYLITRGKVHPYFEDNEHQLLEIKCGDGSLMFGVLLYKNEKIVQTNPNNRTNEKIHFYIEHIKPTALDEIRIPIFTQDLKFRFNNILKKMGLNTIFQKITSKDLFPEGTVKIHDIIQNVKIIIDDASYKEVDNTRGYHSIRKFIADKPFFYYFRATKTNTILVNGYYNT